jgi:hypothetical protein
MHKKRAGAIVLALTALIAVGLFVGGADAKKKYIITKSKQVKPGALEVKNLSKKAQTALLPSAYATYHDAAINMSLAETTVMKLSNLPAGSYVINAKGFFNVNSTNAVPTCKLIAGGDFDTTVSFTLNVAQVQVPWSLQLVHTFASTGEVDLNCLLGNGTNAITTAMNKITAVRVGAITNTASP